MTQAPHSADEIRRVAGRVSPDPFGDDGASRGEWAWVYAQDQYELAVLHRLVRDGYAANRHVDYTQNFGSLSSTVNFHRRLSGMAAVLSILATGGVRVELDGQVLAVLSGSGDRTEVSLPPGGDLVSISVRSPSGPAAFALQPGDTAFAPDSVWEASGAEGGTVEAQVRWGGPGHDQQFPPAGSRLGGVRGGGLG